MVSLSTLKSLIEREGNQERLRELTDEFRERREQVVGRKAKRTLCAKRHRRACKHGNHKLVGAAF